MGNKWVNVSARPPEGGPAETGFFSASNLPLISIPYPARMPDGPAKAGEVWKRRDILEIEKSSPLQQPVWKYASIRLFGLVVVL